MRRQRVQTPQNGQRSASYRLRCVAVAGFTACGGALGRRTLATARGAPPVSMLAPIGLSSWSLPSVWLFATTTVPAGTAACAVVVPVLVRHIHTAAVGLAVDGLVPVGGALSWGRR